ncbi:hypothetical protein RCL1_007424 [Eukaryota sp. TZLM3-RCL]
MINDAPCHHRTCGVRFSDFSFVSDLSSGSQGSTSIWSGPDGKLYCFKQIPLSSSGRVPEAEFLFKDLRSPFVVDILHCFTIEDQLYLCMEYCQGNSLKNLLESRISKTNDDIWFILTQLSHGLHHLHSNSIIHRDVKPANIVLTSQQRPFRIKFCDFGVSKHLDNTFAKTITGTFLFMAPEVLQLQSKGSGEQIHYTFAVDLWSLGVTLYYLVEGKFPFKNPFEILNSEIPVSNSEFGPIISKLLQRDASQRITAKELIELPEIQEIYDSFYDFDNILSVDFQMWLLKRENQRQSKLIMNLGSLFTSQMANLCAKISSLESQNHLLLEKASTLESKLSELGQPLASSLPLNESTTLSKANIVTSANTVASTAVPLNNNDKVIQENDDDSSVEEAEEEETNELMNEYLSNPLEFLSTRTGICELFDSVMFLPETKGSALKLSNNNCVVTSLQSSNANSFVAINFPISSKLVLTLKSVRHGDKSFSTWIGYFDPNICQSSDCWNGFTGLVATKMGTHFYTKGSKERTVTHSIKTNDVVNVELSQDRVTYSIPIHHWQRSISRSTGWVFGLVSSCEGERWTLSVCE